ncbi:MAG: GSCFA domain-containing protein, partial [Flavobacteriaceae bacterium]
NIGEKFKYFKFGSFQNPLGICFHPKAIEMLVSRSVHHALFTEKDLFFHNERWHCFDAHSDLSDVSETVLLKKLNDGLQTTHQKLRNSTHVMLTLGTAWVYKYNASAVVVANCHKVPQKEFSKELLSVATIQKSLETIIDLIKSINPKAHFIFTISPVRHVKDGYVENQISKAHLISAIHNLINSPTYDRGRGGAYFPSYEIMMDELRDYRFYEADMLHPNQVAVDYIWEKFVQVWISEETLPTMEKVDAVQKGLLHRPFNPDSLKHQEFLKSLETKITYLQQRYPFMRFNS